MEPAAVGFKARLHPHPDAPPPDPPPDATPETEDEVVEVKQEKPPIPVVELTDEPPACPFAPPCAPPPTPMAPVLVPPGELIILVGGMYLLGAITGGMLAYSFSKPTCKAA